MIRPLPEDRFIDAAFAAPFPGGRRSGQPAASTLALAAAGSVLAQGSAPAPTPAPAGQAPSKFAPAPVSPQSPRPPIRSLRR